MTENVRTNEKLKVGALCAGLSVFLSLFYWLGRFGFHDPVRPILLSLFLGFFLILLPENIHYFLPRTRTRFGDRWYFSDLVLFPAGLAALSLFGAFASSVGLPVFVLLGGFFFVTRAVRVFGGAPFRLGVPHVIVFLFFFLWLVGYTWHAAYRDPLAVEKIVLGKGYGDLFFHSAYSSMIETYRALSTGLNGLPFVPTHFGSHWVFAQLSRLMGQGPFQFYTLGFPVMFVPALLYFLMTFAVDLRSYLFRNDPDKNVGLGFAAWGFLFLGFAGPLPVPALNWVFYSTPSTILDSESFLLGIVLGLAVLSAALPILDGRLKGNPLPRRDKVFLLGVLPLLMVGAGLTKISILFLMLCVYAYIFVRFGLFRNPTLRASLAVCVLCSAAAVKAFYPAAKTSWRFFDFTRTYIGEGWEAIYFALFYVWPIVYVFGRIFEEGVRDLGGLAGALRSNRLIDVEAVVVLCVCGAFPGEAMAIPGGSAFYFSAVQQWVCIVAVIARLPKWGVLSGWFPEGTMSRVKISRVLIALASVPLLVTAVENSVGGFMKAIGDNFDTRFRILVKAEKERKSRGEAEAAPDRAASDPVARRRALSRLAARDGSNLSFREMMEAAIWGPQLALDDDGTYRLIQGLQDARRLAPDVRRKTAVLIPRSNALYWNILPECRFAPFVAPALSGLAMVDGLPTRDCKSAVYYGYDCYELPAREAVDGFSPDKRDVCGRAANKGFENVLLFDERDGTVTREFISCPETP
jgi:hypothetical protein